MHASVNWFIRFVLRLTCLGTHIAVLCYHARVQLMMGSTTALIQALQSFSLVFGFGSGQNVTPAHLSGYRSSDLHWPQQQFCFSGFFFAMSNTASLPDHFRPCQNTWSPHYAVAHNWLKSKGVPALTDRSGVVYSYRILPGLVLSISLMLQSLQCAHTTRRRDFSFFASSEEGPPRAYKKKGEELCYFSWFKS